MNPVPASRVRRLNHAPVAPGGDFVLYWMVSARRAGWNFALERALEWCAELGKPLLVLEALRVGYPHASERVHAFLLRGMAENARAFDRPGVTYYPYVERAPDGGKGLLAALSAGAAVAVTEDSPAFFFPRMRRAAASQCAVALEAVDTDGLLPRAVAGEKPFVSAHQFRRLLQRALPDHLLAFPRRDPLAEATLGAACGPPPEVIRRWPRAPAEALAASPEFLAGLPIHHGVPLAPHPGGATPARARLRRFLEEGLPRYATERSDPDRDASSGLSPWLHAGHLSAHEVAAAILSDGAWDPSRLSPSRSGSKTGWWGLPEAHEAFLDELVTWRELGYHAAGSLPGYDRYDSLPTWALATLERHAGDLRPHLYSLEELEGARTHDPLWNAAQRQLRREGRMQNYLRMLWGKKVLEWSPSPREAVARLVHLNDRYALDGRDPNSTSGIFWCLGRYDRPWGPERPIFGTVRYMSSENTARKFGVKGYLARWRAEEA